MTSSRGQSLPLPPEGRFKGFYGIFVASFIVFLVVALAAQVFTGNWRAWFPGAEGDRSMIDGVKASVYTFMSYLA
jgi:light-harvesting complex 1 beta chain